MRIQAASPCQGGLVCLQGRCAKPLLASAACHESFECDGDLRCIDGKCDQPLAAGAPCKAEDFSCGAGLGCIDGKCATLRAGGEPCTSDFDCASNDCTGERDFDDTVHNGHCEAATIYAEIGESCAPGSNPAGGNGGPACRYYAFCDATTMRCLLLKPVGAVCTMDQHCTGGLVCTSGKCQLGPPPMCAKP